MFMFIVGFEHDTVLRQVRLPTNDTSFDTHFTNATMSVRCEQGDNKTCPGNSSWSLQCRQGDGAWRLHGISTRNNDHGYRPSLVTYTRVNKFVSWMEKTMNGTTSTKGSCNQSAVLTGSSGEFGTEGYKYSNNEKCQWKIEIEEGQVGPHCFFSTCILIQI
ncbi:hypothetical protein LSAT2_027853 [Lamellibrachia satsuma]|nr:hypothetical protein LSAT2_027853 [Lamellibrachia satsuma]